MPVNPHLDEVRTHIKAWAADMGMFRTGVWDEQAFDAADYGRFVALTHPDAALPELRLVADWHVWGWFLDDFFTQMFKRRRDFPGGKAYLQLLWSMLGTAAPMPADPAQRGLADLWARTSAAMSAGLRDRVAADVKDWSGSMLWELHNLAQSRVPDPVDYLEMRRRNTASELSATLIRFTSGEDVADTEFETRSMKALARTFADIGSLRDDISAYPKHIRDGVVLTNGVVVTQQFFGIDPGQAVSVLNDLTAARAEEFERIAQGLDATVARHVQALRHWLAGHQQWSSGTGRYHATAPLLVSLPSGPSGLGTAAVRITA